MKKVVYLLTIFAAVFLLFAGCGSVKKEESTKVGKSSFDINVYVKDEQGEAVEGVKIQACDDSVCMLAGTDIDGHAGFNMSAEKTEIHILKVPEGYTVDTDTVYMLDENGNLNLVIKTAEK